MPSAKPTSIAVVPVGPATPSLSPAPAKPRQKQREPFAPGKTDLFLLGITIVLGGQFFSWNAGLHAGLYSYFGCYALIASAYITLCCCTSEITGALPFAGGAYGLARCTLGFFPAFLIGCCEALEYIAYVASSVLSLGDMIVQAAPSLHAYRWLLWLAFYASAIAVHVAGDRVFWTVNRLLALVSLAVLALYVFGSICFADYKTYAAGDASLLVIGGFPAFLKALPLCCWFFVGVEALNLASDHVKEPKRSIPRAQITCVSTLAVSGIAVVLVTVSLAPGLRLLPFELTPFNNGFSQLFQLAPRDATILSLPATYATAFGFMWCYGQLIAAMATSRLLPARLAHAAETTSTRKSPLAAIVAGSVLSYACCLLVSFAPSLSDYLFNVCILSAFMSYTGQCIGYISLKRSYKNITSSAFRSPFGVAGAVYSMAVWALAIVSIVAFQGHGGVEIGAFAGVVALLSVYYYAWARRRQTFSAQENRVMLVAHVMKFNGRRKVGAKPPPRTTASSVVSTSKVASTTMTVHVRSPSKA
ncbi:hypothetical protein PINS_up011689 [Pythium insidiosum]|nr:hypothetical protein PINS_up011689 [Pythium insidiosum]